MGSGLCGIVTVIVTFADERAQARGLRVSLLLGIMGTGLGIGAAQYVLRQLTPQLNRRREALEGLRDRIKQQLRAETQWTVVREARRAAALRPSSTRDLAIVGGLCALATLLLGFGIGRGEGLAWAAGLVAAIAFVLFVAVRSSPETRTKRGVTLHLDSIKRRR